MLWFVRQDDFRRRLQMAHDALSESAAAKGEDACCKSGRCCWSGPCRLAPGDETKIAVHLGVTVGELFAQYLVVDENRAGDALVVFPRRRQWEGGHYLSDDETYDADTPCVFLTDADGCQIHGAKPSGGAHYKCWDTSTHGEPPGCEWSEEQVMALGWNGDRFWGGAE